MRISTPPRPVAVHPTGSPVRTFLFVVVQFIVLALISLGVLPPLRADGGHDHGDHQIDFEITTTAPAAQKHFEAGLYEAWGFNHIEAARSFDRALTEDPQCAMCAWGKALVLGPNINDRLDLVHHDALRTALAKAVERAPKTTEREQALIGALEARYGDAPLEDRSARDQAYARAMRRVARAYPDNLTIATLFAESLMDTTAWDYWTDDGEPRPVTTEFLELLTSVLERDEAHPGANHLLIHAVEKVRPDLGEPAADRLADGEQATGHLVHMASHIYIRLGRYDDAIRVNQRAIKDDDNYAAKHPVPPEYFTYMLHNHHMLAVAAMFSGEQSLSAPAMAHIRDQVDKDSMADPGAGALQLYYSAHLFEKIRFERWNEILAQKDPGTELAFPRAIWHTARGLALQATGEQAAAREELVAVSRIAADTSLEETSIWGLNSVRRIVEIGHRVLAGRLAAADGDMKSAIGHLEKAVEFEDALVYDEPPPWPIPVRQILGETLLAAGRSDDAAKRFAEDLAIYPKNVVSLAGMERASQ